MRRLPLLVGCRVTGLLCSKRNATGVTGGVHKRRKTVVVPETILSAAGQMVKNQKAKLDTPLPIAQEEKGPVSGAVDNGKGVAELSDEDLLKRVNVSFVFESAHAFIAKIAAWSQLPSEPTAFRLEKELSLAIEQGSLEAYASIYSDFKKRYEDSVRKGTQSSLFLYNYLKMLVNYGSYGLINFEAQKAIGLLQESFVFLDRLKENAQRAPSSLDFLPEEQREMLLHKDTDLATLYLRVLLADAYLCNQQHFEAAGELIRAEGMLDMAHLSGMWQVCPGTECLQPLNRAYVVEECEQFFKSFTNKDKALHEARAHSLRLHSKHAEPEELLHFTLLCARLHRKTENYPNAKKLFEKYLDALVEQNVEDHEYAMLELGRMMVYDMKKRKSGLVYLESATELMLADLLTYEQDGQTDTTAYKLLCVRCAGALLDVADVLEMNMDSNKALGVVQEAFELLLKSNNASMSAWVSLKYANLLSSLSMTDQAIETYLLTLETLSNPSLHVALGGRLEELSRANVEATLAHCYQVRVGDFRSACRHYKNVMDTADNGSPKRRARRIGKSATPPVVSTETVSFVLTNLVHCCERMGDSEAALDHQWRLFELGLSLGHCEPGVFMKLIDLANADEKLFSLCSELFVNIPMDELSPAVRLKLAETLTYCICKLGYLSTGNLFHKVVQQAYKSQNFMLSAAVHGDYGASDGTETSKTQFFAEQLKAMVLFTVEVFAVDLVVDGEENKARAAEGKPPQARDFEKEKMTLMVLNRVGLYFHANGFSEEAKELYELGLRHSESLGDGVKSTLYLREVGILSANYATLMYRQAPEVAEKYYDLGVKLCPEECSVQEVAGSFYTEQASVEKASTFARSLAAKFPDRSTVYYTNMAYMLINRFWDTLTPTQKLQTVCDTLLACNIAAARIPKVEEGVTDETLLDRVAEMEGLLLDAAVSCFTVDSATLLGYLFLGKFQELPRLTNKIFRECIRRFPNGSALLALYAPFCYQHGHIRLARMYYAKSYALEDGSDLRTNGYTVFLERMQHQIPLCEALVRCSLDRFPTAERHTAYAHFLSMHMPTPFKVDKYYTEAIALNPTDPNVYHLYAYFIWSTLDNEAVDEHPLVKEALVKKIESLLQKAVELAPNDQSMLLSLGTFYAKSERFDPALDFFRRAITIQPNNLEALNKISTVLAEACHKMAGEERAKLSGAARQGLVGSTTPRLRGLKNFTQAMFEASLKMDPDNTEIIEQYATFAVNVLKDTNLASQLWKMAARLRDS